MVKDDCKSPNIWVSGTINPYTKGYCTTVKEILNVEKFACKHPNVWVPGTKKPFKKGFCAVPNLKTKTPSPKKTLSPKKSPIKIPTPKKTPSPKKSPTLSLTEIMEILKPQLNYTSKTPQSTNDAIDFVISKEQKNQVEKCIINKNCDGKLAIGINLFDNMFKYIPKLTKPITVYKNFKDKIEQDFSTMLYTAMHPTKPQLDGKYQMCVNIPAGSKILPYKNKIIFPRESLFDFINYDEVNKISHFNLRLPQNLPIQNLPVSPLQPQLDFMNNLKPDEIEAIKFVRDESNKPLLKKIIIQGEIPSDNIAKYLNTMDTLFTKIPKLTTDFFAYRKYTKSEKIGKILKVGTYNSIDLNIKDKYIKNWHFIVKVPKGTQVLPYITPKGKQIFILPRSSQFVVTSVNNNKIEVDLIIDKQPIYSTDTSGDKNIPLKPFNEVDFASQINYITGIQQAFKNSLEKVTKQQKYNLMIESDSLGNVGSYEEQINVNYVDKIFIGIPATKHELDAMFYHYDLDGPSKFKTFAKSYRTADIPNNSSLPSKHYYKVIIPKNSKVIINKTNHKVMFPRDSHFKLISPKVYEYVISSKLPTWKITKEQQQQQQKQPQKTSHKEHHPKSATYIDMDYTKLLEPQINFMKNLDVKTIQALKFYTGNGYTTINSTLNKGSEPSPKVAEYINSIDELYKKVPPTTKTFIVYRGIKLNKKIEKDFTNKAYVSTSSNKNVSLNFGGNKLYKCCFFEISIPKGSHILPVMPLSSHSHEMEILLPRESEFHIVKHSFTPKENTVITKYVEKLGNIKPFDIPKPQSKKTTSTVGATAQKTCPPNTKVNPEKYICNPATGKWVLKTGDIGKKLLKNM